MAELRPKIVKLCHIVGGLTGVVNKIDENAPEYYCLASIVTDEEAGAKLKGRKYYDWVFQNEPKWAAYRKI